MKHSTGKPTKYEQQRFEAMLDLGCVCCAQLGIWNTAVDIQHIVEGDRRLGHWYTIPVCPGHHRGVWTSDQVEAIPPDLRIAISDGSKMFYKHYGTERQLWMKVQARLKLPAVWPSSKILPRRLGGNREIFAPPMGSVSHLESETGPVEDASPDSLRVALADREGSRASVAGEES
jgi:hypothetical protein